jgi:uncharacterized HAD superfamily protein
MPLNPIATITTKVHSNHRLSGTVEDMTDSMLDKLYNVNQQRYKKYKKMTNKYITMNQTTNPHINSQDNTVYYIKNESEYEKNTENLYKNNIQRINNK